MFFIRTLWTYILISRPVGWVMHLIAFLAGIIFSGAGLNTVIILQAISFTFPLGLIVYGINDIYDKESDDLNPRKKGGIWTKAISHDNVNSVIIGSWICFVLVFVISLFSLNIWNIISVLLGIVIALAYSVPPIRLKNRPPFDLLCNSLSITILFISGLNHGLSSYQRIIPAVIWIFLWATGLSILSSLGDLEADKEASEKTIATWLGIRKSLFLAIISLIPIYPIWYIWFQGSKPLGAILFPISLTIILCILEFIVNKPKRMTRLYIISVGVNVLAGCIALAIAIISRFIQTV